MSVNLMEIVESVEKTAPLKLAEKWDNSGLIIGDINSDVSKVLVALDAVDAVVDEAVSIGANMILTHHPLILFDDLKKINTASNIGRRIYKLIQNNIAVYSAHTSLDISLGGTNDVLAKLAGLVDIGLLEVTEVEALKKLIVFVPEGYEEIVREAMCTAGAGHIGMYSNCSFSTKGKGTFLPLEGTKPFIGVINELETTNEVRVETIVPESILNNVIKTMVEAHPYEDPAYDIYNIEREGIKQGIGRIGNLKNPIQFDEFALMFKNKLGLDSMRVVGNLKKKISKVGLCTGSGFSFLDSAKKCGCDLYITSDIKFHEAQKAQQEDICLIDATHFASENIIVPVLADYIENEFGSRGVKSFVSGFDGQPFINI